MDVLFQYVLKSGAISAVLFGYYWLFLRNRSFHRWNRGFLLATILFSVVLPLVPMPGMLSRTMPGLFSWTALGGNDGWSRVWHAVTPGKWNGDADGSPVVVAAGGIEWSTVWIVGYELVVLCLAFVFLRQLGFIARMYRRYPRERRGGILFLLTREPGTPFSFWRMIFWNADVEMESAEGRQMLRHELVHVRRRHTLDLLLVRPMLILFWVNPVFYWVYRELKTIHEFEADESALEGEDRYAYAELLVWQTLGSRPGLFHSFFSSSIKRRINMITKNPFVAPGRWSRWMVAPMACLLLCAFSGRMDRVRVSKKPITVVIDAGHGGWDDGAVAPNGLKEKNINLSLAQMVKRLAPSYGVNVVLTRDADVLSGGLKNKQASLHYRANLAGEKKADLFISLHTDAGSGANEAGFHVYVTGENVYHQQSARLGGSLIDALKSCYTVGDELKETQEHVWVLRAATVPAVMVLCGNIDNERDRAFISNTSNQEKIARGILEGVVHYNP